MQPAKLNYKVYQGSTFQEVYRWESQTKVYKPIENITKAAPCIITTTGYHDMPPGWRFRVVGAGGMKEINSVSDSYYTATDTIGNVIELNSINSLQYTAYTTGGIIEYNTPVDISTLKARLQIRKTTASTDVIYQATSDTGQIVLSDTYKTITLTIPASVTAGFTFATAVYSMELYDTAGRVIPFLTGNLTLVQEVTR